jgi:hypothetical protein
LPNADNPKLKFSTKVSSALFNSSADDHSRSQQSSSLREAHHPLGIGITFGVVISGKHLFDSESRTSFHQRAARWLRAVCPALGLTRFPFPECLWEAADQPLYLMLPANANSLTAHCNNARQFFAVAVNHPHDIRPAGELAAFLLILRLAKEAAVREPSACGQRARPGHAGAGTDSSNQLTMLIASLNCAPPPVTAPEKI